MSIDKAKEIIFQAQMAAYPNAEHAKTLGGLYALIEELEQYRALGDLDRLKELIEADRDGRCLIVPKEKHQPMFVKMDAVDIFDQWHDVTGALGKGTSWYYEAQAVVEEVAAMAFGAGIFYEAERRAEAEAALKGADG